MADAVPSTGARQTQGSNAGQVGQFVTALGSAAINSNTSAIGGKSTNINLNQGEYDRIIGSILTNAPGLAKLANGIDIGGGKSGNAAGGMFSDSYRDVVQGMFDVITARTEDTSKQKTKMSVICTELVVQGKLDVELYSRGNANFASLPDRVIHGYHIWGIPTARLISKYPRLGSCLLPVVVKRYLHLSGNKNCIGWLTVVIGEPVCYAIGWLAEKFSREVSYG